MKDNIEMIDVLDHMMLFSRYDDEGVIKGLLENLTITDAIKLGHIYANENLK